MKDIHSHILYGIDDGSTSLEESLDLLSKLEHEGVTDIVVTPHYIIGSDYNSNNADKRKILEEVKKKTNIKMYLGNEVFLDNNILEYIKKKEISTINNSQYLLVEFPLTQKLNNYKEILFNLRKIGCIPIIAHPERYHYLKIEDFIELVESGCLLQGNITSLCGKYGRDAKKNLELLLRKHMIHVLGTDTHRHVLPIQDCVKELEKILDKKMIEDITVNNFDKIIVGDNIEPFEIIDTNSFFNKEKFK